MEVATKAGGLWIEHGALDYKECLADDVKVGELTSFPRSVKLEDDETVIFAWITYESRQHRDDVNARVTPHPPHLAPAPAARPRRHGHALNIDLLT